MRTDNLVAPRRCAVLVAALGAALTVGCSSIPTRESETVTELPIYSIQELGLLPGGSVSQASGVNGAGLVVDYANECGVIVGWAFPAGSTQRRAVAWVPEGCSIQ